MLIESIIRRKAGTKTLLGSTTYHFKPDTYGRHVAEVEDKSHVAKLLAIPEGYRRASADGSAPAAAAIDPTETGFFFIVRGPQDLHALTDWVRSIPEMEDEPGEFTALVDKIAVGDASLGGHELVVTEAPALTGENQGQRTRRAPTESSIIPSQSQQEGGDAGAQDVGGGGAGSEGGPGAETRQEDAPQALDREKLAQDYAELFGHRPNGKWNAEKIADAIAEKGQG